MGHVFDLFLSLGAVSGIVAVAMKERVLARVRRELAAERTDHATTRGERDQLRAELGRAADVHARLTNELDELRALREGGGAYR